MYLSFAASLDGSLKERLNNSREVAEIENYLNLGVANLLP
jgi:hypothetical protein